MNTIILRGCVSFVNLVSFQLLLHVSGASVVASCVGVGHILHQEKSLNRVGKKCANIQKCLWES